MCLISHGRILKERPASSGFRWDNSSGPVAAGLIMIICEFCLHYRKECKCELGLNIPKGMSCREFDASLAGFCSDPNDFVNASQIINMAAFFGIKRMELKKVTLIAVREERIAAAEPASS